MERLGTIIVLLAILTTASLHAQPTARITTMTVERGNSEALFTLSVLCDGTVQYQLTPSQLTITDNGTPVNDFSIIESSSPSVRNAISAALVLDASGSMMGSPNAATVLAANGFVQLMDGVIDEAAVLFFNQTVTLQQGITSDKNTLQAAVSQLPASGATAVWDAGYTGVQIISAGASNQKRAVVLLTDGGDNSSQHSTTDLIAYSQQQNIRIFTIGLGSAVNTSGLQLVAQLTGGQYFSAPTPADLQVIFTQIATFMGRGFDEHTVAFRSPDPEADWHDISVTVRICDDEATSEHGEAALTVTGISSTRPALPSVVELQQNAPNPFAPGSSTVIPYTIHGTSPRHVTLSVFDILGRQVATLVDGSRPAGHYTATFTPDGLARGTYLYRLSAGGIVTSKLMILR